MAAELPTIRPDVLIVESTYGTHIHEKREDRENRFTTTVHDIVTRQAQNYFLRFVKQSRVNLTQSSTLLKRLHTPGLSLNRTF